MSTFTHDYAEEQRQREARLPKYKTVLLMLLRAAKASAAIIQYDGEGDGGHINSVKLYNAANATQPDKPLSKRSLKHFSDLHLFKQTLEGALEAFAWELLAVHHDGFEDNDGAFGTITVDVAKESVVIDHNARFSDSVHSTSEV